ncbi:MAG: hypothetical protein IT445_11620 [Phycisphaeraceae bacterium]|nr:hypothetical protein [Phycisphaeraceae bacterium]
MTQRYDQDAILGYVEGELSQQQRQAFELLLAADPALRQLVNDLLADREALRQLSLRDSAPIGLVDAAIGHLERRMLLGGDELADMQPRLAGTIPISTTPHARLSRTRLLVGLAVAAILLISGGIILQTLVLPPDQSPTQLADSTAHPLLDEPTLEPGATEQMADATFGLREAGEQPAAGSDVSQTEEATAAASAAEPVTAPPTETLAQAPRQLPTAALSSAAKAPALDQPQLKGTERTNDRDQLPAASQMVMSRIAPQTDQKVNRLTRGRSEATPTRIEVTTARTNDTQQQVMQWAISNRAQVIEPTFQPPAPLPSASSSAVGRSMMPSRGAQTTSSFFSAQTASVPQARPQTLIVQMDESQVEQLADYLNTQAGQRAAVVRDQREWFLGRATGQPKAETEALGQAPVQAQGLAGFASVPAPTPIAEADGSKPDVSKPDAAEPSAPFDLDIDWAQVLNNQLPLTPVQHFAGAKRTPLPDPARRVNVVVELIETSPPSSSHDSPATHEP